MNWSGVMMLADVSDLSRSTIIAHARSVEFSIATTAAWNCNMKLYISTASERNDFTHLQVLIHYVVYWTLQCFHVRKRTLNMLLLLCGAFKTAKPKWKSILLQLINSKIKFSFVWFTSRTIWSSLGFITKAPLISPDTTVQSSRSMSKWSIK